MKEKVVEPSEILVEQTKGTINEDTVHINPWIRFLARFFDYSLLFLFLGTFRYLTHGHFPRGVYEQLVPFEFFVWMPIEAFLIAKWGTTPGKFFLKIKLRHGAAPKFDFATAFRRSFHVWFRGLGMGILGINFLCMLTAYHRLKTLRKTSWDRDDHVVVTHAPIGTWRLIVSAILIGATFLFYTFFYTMKS